MYLLYATEVPSSHMLVNSKSLPRDTYMSLAALSPKSTVLNEFKRYLGPRVNQHYHRHNRLDRKRVRRSARPRRDSGILQDSSRNPHYPLARSLAAPHSGQDAGQKTFGMFTTTVHRHHAFLKTPRALIMALVRRQIPFCRP